MLTVYPQKNQISPINFISERGQTVENQIPLQPEGDCPFVVSGIFSVFDLWNTNNLRIEYGHTSNTTQIPKGAAACAGRLCGF